MVASVLTVNTLSIRRTCPEMFGAKTNATFPFYLFLSLHDSLILATLITPVVSSGSRHTLSYYFVGFVGNLRSNLHQQSMLQLMIFFW